ncbi:GTP-binding protein HflX [Limosilactobacillus coleohominis DSM 14060]|nr:GTP-binding protein HflX [Limosilactobacillus coleohominis DSM 14060]
MTEAAKADLLIQIIDYSDPHRDEMIKTTEKTLHQIGIDNIPMIYVFNKADKTDFEYPTMEGDDHLVISAKDEKSLDLFIKTIKDHLFDDYVDAKLLIPFTDGHVVSYLNEHANITDTDYQNDGTLLQVEISLRDLQRFSQYVVE